MTRLAVCLGQSIRRSVEDVITYSEVSHRSITVITAGLAVCGLRPSVAPDCYRDAERGPIGSPRSCAVPTGRTHVWTAVTSRQLEAVQTRMSNHEDDLCPRSPRLSAGSAPGGLRSPGIRPSDRSLSRPTRAVLSRESRRVSHSATETRPARRHVVTHLATPTQVRNVEQTKGLESVWIRALLW
jgi:hypothetical protein